MTTVLVQPPSDPVVLLRSSDVFAELSDRLLHEAAAGMKWRHVLSGEVLFRQGEPGDALYLVVSGRLRVTAENGDGRERVLREVGRGGHVGELALLTDEPRSATVRAVRDTIVASFSRERFQHLVSRHPAAVLPLTRTLATLVRRAHVPAGASVAAATVALVPLHRDVAVDQLAAQLCQALAAHGAVLRVDRRFVESHLPRGVAHSDEQHPGQSVLSAWLDELEVTHRFLIYEGDVGSPAWTRRCMREADRVLFVASAIGEPHAAAQTVTRLLRNASPSTAREELVLLHPEGRTPEGTAEWLGLRAFAAHHHVCLAEPRHVERLARCLTGTSIGVVLGGGAAKGFAHIGVLRALEEAGIPIDHIGGTSMGSVIAAQYAAGVSPAKMLELNRLWATHNPLRDVTLPVIALISGTSGRVLLEAMFGERRIEDLWLDYFCVSANLTRSEVAVHRAGPLQQWVRASIAIPGIVAPLRLDNGDLLVDGAVLNNLPADIMRTIGAGRVIAVDVTPPEALPTDDYTDQPSTMQSLRLLRSAILPFGTPPRSPTIFSILYRTVLTASRSLSERLKHEVDLYVAPPVGDVGFFDWKALERIAEVGFRDGRRRVEGWKEAAAIRKTTAASRPSLRTVRRTGRAEGRRSGAGGRLTRSAR